jgi:hypothetical protein
VGYHAIILVECFDRCDWIIFVEVVYHDVSDIFVFVLQPEEALPIKVKWNRVLVEFDLAFTVALQSVLFQITHVDGRGFDELEVASVVFSLQF